MTARAMIVEDEPHIVESLTFLLEREGFDVESIADGASALAAVEADAPDVLILDVMLPGLDGLEVLRRLRERDATAALPVLMLTAKGQRRDRGAAAEAGADLFMAKPFSNAAVVEAVKSLVGRAPNDAAR